MSTLSGQMLGENAAGELDKASAMLSARHTRLGSIFGRVQQFGIAFHDAPHEARSGDFA